MPDRAAIWRAWMPRGAARGVTPRDWKGGRSRSELCQLLTRQHGRGGRGSHNAHCDRHTRRVPPATPRKCTRVTGAAMGSGSRPRPRARRGYHESPQTGIVGYCAPARCNNDSLHHKKKTRGNNSWLCGCCPPPQSAAAPLANQPVGIAWTEPTAAPFPPLPPTPGPVEIHPAPAM